ncbi:MAG: glycoside hydrolase family 30 beta sandwich domain-containing protein [Bacteroidales bacterium]
MGFNNPEESLLVTALQNPDKSIVVVVLNMESKSKNIELLLNNKCVQVQINGQAIQTIIIPAIN